jgi:hypothetical protein
VPFVQGHLREEHLSFTIDTECGHCGEPIQIEMDSELAYQVVQGAEPLVYVPMVDVHELDDPSIIDGF